MGAGPYPSGIGEKVGFCIRFTVGTGSKCGEENASYASCLLKVGLMFENIIQVVGTSHIALL